MVLLVGEGPGSYTGLRIGAATAKALCYALNKPLVRVDSLQTLAMCMADACNRLPGIYLACYDALRNEIYAGCYD